MSQCRGGFSRFAACRRCRRSTVGDGELHARRSSQGTFIERHGWCRRWSATVGLPSSLCAGHDITTTITSPSSPDGLLLATDDRQPTGCACCVPGRRAVLSCAVLLCCSLLRCDALPRASLLTFDCSCSSCGRRASVADGGPLDLTAPFVGWPLMGHRHHHRHHHHPRRAHVYPTCRPMPCERTPTHPMVPKTVVVRSLPSHLWLRPVPTTVTLPSPLFQPTRTTPPRIASPLHLRPSALSVSHHHDKPTPALVVC